MIDEQVLELSASKIDMHYDELDTNAINFQHTNGYLSIQIQIYIDEDNDPIENETYFELDDASTGEYISIQKIHLSINQISIDLSDFFCSTYSKIILNLPHGLNKKIVGFLINHLFLGGVAAYDEDFPEELKVAQTEFREYL